MKKTDLRQVGCILAGVVLCGAAALGSDNSLEEGRKLPRSTYGGGEREESILVSGLLPEEVPITIPVGEREYGEEEAGKAMDLAAEGIAASMLGENASPEEVRSFLVLPESAEGGNITVQWKGTEDGVIDDRGRIRPEGLPEEGRQEVLTCVLSAGDYEREYTYPLRVFPPEQTREELMVAAFRQYLLGEEARQREEESFLLPERFEGRALTYERQKDSTFLIFPFLGIIAAMLMPLLDRQKEDEAKKKREFEMMRDYPEIISMLVVFTGAGLPVRQAFGRIAADYEESGETREAYEEVARAHHMMERGMPEVAAYESFAARCRYLPYRKLAALLVQNVRNGSDRMREALEAEMENAFEERKNLARRQGEEASTKLLLPLIMMLAMVMVMITVPAFLAFGIGA